MFIICTLTKQLFYYDMPTSFFSLSFTVIIIIDFKQDITHNNIYAFYKLIYNLMIQNKIFVNIMISVYMELFLFFEYSFEKICI